MARPIERITLTVNIVFHFKNPQNNKGKLEEIKFINFEYRKR